MKKLILHVGLHKTGSSAIQASLANGILNVSNYTYHGFGEQNGSVGLYTLFSDQPHLHPQHIRMGLSQADVLQYRKKLITEFEHLLSTSTQHVVLSGEDCSILSANELSKIPPYFNRFGFEVTVVIYIRPWHNLISSVWCELLKHGSTHIDLNFDKELWDFQLNLKTKILKFDDVFGKDRVKVYCYDKHNFPNGCVVQDFCSRLNIACDTSRIVNANMGFKLPTAQLFYIYRKYGPPRDNGRHQYKSNQGLIYALESLKGPSVYFHSRLTETLLAPYRLQKPWFEERLACPFNEVFHDEHPNVIRDESDLLNLTDTAKAWLGEHGNIDMALLASNQISYADIAHEIDLFKRKLVPRKKESIKKRVLRRTKKLLDMALKPFKAN